jgi:hypothetical protein
MPVPGVFSGSVAQDERVAAMPDMTDQRRRAIILRLARHRRCSGQAGPPAAKFFLSAAIFSSGGACQATLSRIVRVAWGCAMEIDLQAKAQKYETKAAQCEQRARLATDRPEQAFYEVLAHYYGEVATDFRQVIEKRTAP